MSDSGRLQGRFGLDLGGFRLRAELDVPATGVVALFGPSGSGKTTLLRCIAGLERARDGFVQLGNQIWQDESRRLFVPPQRRAIGVVFQEPRLFPHLDVRANLLYGWRRTPAAERRLDPEHVSDVLGLDALLRRRPPKLSGGEAQRVAIGRALLASPQLLLLDEPLSSLDAARKREILPFIRRLHGAFGIPIVYVTHAIGEILQLASTVVLMQDGVVVATGRLGEVFARPDLRGMLAASAVGSVLDTTVVTHEPEFGLTRVDFRGSALEIPHRRLGPGEPLRVHVLPRDVTLQVEPAAGRSSALNVLPARVVDLTPDPEETWAVDVRLDAGSPLLARITRKSAAALGLRPGVWVWAHVKAAALSDELLE
jgi:molybdate transport system ATP-binding protein